MQWRDRNCGNCAFYAYGYCEHADARDAKTGAVREVDQDDRCSGHRTEEEVDGEADVRRVAAIDAARRLAFADVIVAAARGDDFGDLSDVPADLADPEASAAAGH